MGNRGHLEKQERARELRSRAWTLDEIAAELGCAKSSASLWTRGVEFTPKPRNRGIGVHRPHPMYVKKLAEIEECKQWASEQLGVMSDRDLFMAGIGLYAGDGAKTGGSVKFSNNNSDLVKLFCEWLRLFFDPTELKFRCRLYLHQGLDLERAEQHWSDVTDIPRTQFTKAYRAVPDHSIRHTKHEFGCAHISYACARSMRKVLGLLEALVS